MKLVKSLSLVVLILVIFTFRFPPSVSARCYSTSCFSPACMSGNSCGYSCQPDSQSGQTGAVEECVNGPEPNPSCPSGYAQTNCYTPCDTTSDVKALCGEATCRGQNQACSVNSDCCAGFSCNGGACAGACSGSEPDSLTCATNGGTWTLATENTTCSPAVRKLTNGQYCISPGGIFGWCNVNNCQTHKPSPLTCPIVNNSGCAAAGCVYINDSSIQNISCSYCACPGGAPTGCTNWTLTTFLGYGSTTTAQTSINSGNCTGAGISWYSNSSVNIPALVGNASSSTAIRRICTYADSPSLNSLSIVDTTNNVTIASGATDSQKFSYNINPLKSSNPGDIVTITGSRVASGGYCAKSDNIAFCASNSPSQATNGYPNGDYLNSPPTQAAPQIDSQASASINSRSEPLTWTHTIDDNTNGLLLVGISYRGNPNPNGNCSPNCKIFENSIDDGDADDYVKGVTFTQPNGVTKDLTRVPGSHSQFIQGTNRGGKRHTVLFYYLAPPNEALKINVTWKAAFPDPTESVGGSVSYTEALQGINPTTGVPYAFAQILKNKGVTSTCTNGVCPGEPTISLPNANISQTAVAVIAGQTDSNNQNPPDLQSGPRSRWRRMTADRNIYGQGAELISSSKTGATIKFDWIYGYSSASWAISSVLLNPAISRFPGSLYWQNPSWGNVCGGGNKHNYVYIRRSDGTPISPSDGTDTGRASELDVSTNPNINFNPRDETLYTWYVETSNISGGTLVNNPNRVKSPQWSFKIQAGTNLTATPSAIIQAAPTATTTFRITNTGGTTINNVYASFKDGNGNTYGPYGPLCPTGVSPCRLDSWWYVDQAVSFPLPPPGTYPSQVITDPNNDIVETDETAADNQPILNYTVPPRPAFFQSVGGGITSLGTITSTLPSIGDSLSKNTVGHTDAGIISAKNSPINRGLGIFSQNGTSPGWNRTGITSVPKTTELTYTNLYNTVLTNAGVNPSTATSSCSPVPCSFTSGTYTIYVYYNPTDINSYISSAPTTGTTILIPATGAVTPTLSNPVSPISIASPNSKRIILFVNTNLSIPGDVNVATTDNNSGLVVIVNGNITVNDVVGQLDGLYLFNGTLNSNSGPILSNQLLGNGSLIGTGATPFNLRRTYGTTGPINPAELWTYQGKYLWLFRNILTRPSYSWKELPPQ